MINSINNGSSYWYTQSQNNSLNTLLTAATTNNKNLTVSSSTKTTSDSNDSTDLTSSNMSVEELMAMLKSGTMPPPQGEASDASTEESTSETITDDSLSAYDTDGDGSISKDEYESMISELGIENALSADELYAQYDTNGDGELSTDEIEAAQSQTQPLMPPPPMGPPPEEDSEDDTTGISAVSTDGTSETTVDDSLSTYDTDGDGSISKDEYESMISELGIENALSADELYAQYDTNGDGELSTDEIEAAQSQTQPLMPPPPMGPPPEVDSEDDTTGISAVSTDDASETTAEEVFSAYDTNQDGTIDADEFAAMWESASKAYEASFQYIFDDTVDSTLSKSV